MTNDQKEILARIYQAFKCLEEEGFYVDRARKYGPTNVMLDMEKAGCKYHAFYSLAVYELFKQDINQSIAIGFGSSDGGDTLMNQKVGRMIVEVLRMEGLKTRWNGSAGCYVEVVGLLDGDGEGASNVCFSEYKHRDQDCYKCRARDMCRDVTREKVK